MELIGKSWLKFVFLGGGGGHSYDDCHKMWNSQLKIKFHYYYIYPYLISCSN